MITHEEQTSLRVVHDVVNLFGIEFVKDGDCDSPISKGGKESNGPLGRVTSAKGYLITFLNTTVLKQDV